MSETEPIDASEFAPDLSEQIPTELIVAQANTILEYLIQACDPDWEKVLEEVLNRTELAQADLNVGSKLRILGVRQPHGAVAKSTGQVKAAVGIDGEIAQRAIGLLKDMHHLVQCGRGRGKALVLIHTTPITDQGTPQVVVSAGRSGSARSGAIAPHDVPALLRAARESHITLVTKYNELVAQVDAQAKYIADLEVQVDELKAKNNLSAMTTWS